MYRLFLVAVTILISHTLEKNTVAQHLAPTSSSFDLRFSPSHHDVVRDEIHEEPRLPVGSTHVSSSGAGAMEPFFVVHQSRTLEVVQTTYA